MINRYKLLMVLFFISIITINAAIVEPLTINDPDNLYSLNRDWHFSVENRDFNRLTNIDFNNWYTANITGAWNFNVPEEADHYDYAWYQLPLIIDEKIDDLGLYMPICYGGYKVYLNNTLIYDGAISFGYPPAVIYIDKNYLKTGENSLLLKVGNFSSWGGFGGFMEIGNYKKARSSWILYIIKNAAIALISLFLSIYFIIMYIFRRQEKYNIFFAGFSMSVALFISGYYGISFYLLNQPWVYWVLTFLGGINMYLFPILFIHSFYNIRLKLGAKIFTGIYIFLSTFVILEYLITGQIFYFNLFLYNPFNLTYILVVTYLIVISIQAVRKDYDYARTMLIGVILLGLFFVYSMLCFSLIIIKPPLIGEGFFFMILAYAVILGKRFALTHSSLEREYALNVELSESLEIKVEERTKELAIKNKEIIESIEYAALIQNSILPNEGQLKEIFSDFYIHWKPKDIVGGDFYWVLEKESGFIAAIIDCTGHGVPGALLTMTVKSLLERIVTHINSDDPGLIISNLNKLLKTVLSQDNPYEIKDDGLEIAMCIYNNVEQNMSFAGSRMRMYTCCNGTINEYRGEKQGVGYKRSRYGYNYKTTSVTLAPGMSFHMTTDGYPEQSGGEKGYSFGWQKYTETLLEVSDKSMKAQKELLDKKLIEFQGEYSQRDDITLFGFKLKD